MSAAEGYCRAANAKPPPCAGKTLHSSRIPRLHEETRERADTGIDLRALVSDRRGRCLWSVWWRVFSAFHIRSGSYTLYKHTHTYIRCASGEIS